MLARRLTEGVGVVARMLAIGRWGYHPGMPGVWNIAHRGASVDRPENTLAAFEEAVRQGADVIEADIRVTSDGELLVLHDATLDRTTNAQGALAEANYARARSLDAGRGERIPTPDEVLEVARDRVRVTFDIKDDDAVDGLVAMVRELEMSESVTYMSFQPEVADRIRALGLASPVMQSVDSAAGLASITTRHGGVYHGISGIGIPAALISAELTEDLQRHGFGVFAWTVDDPDEMQRLISCGVNGILTNRPGVLAAVLREQRATRT
jgi:glycerophosphoryl diester phosphodiesterase